MCMCMGAAPFWPCGHACVVLNVYVPYCVCRQVARGGVARSCGQEKRPSSRFALFPRSSPLLPLLPLPSTHTHIYLPVPPPPTPTAPLLYAYTPHTPCYPEQPYADAIGSRCGIDKSYTMSFGEEVVRGQTVFTLSWMLSELEKHLRVAAGAGAWQVCAAAGTGSQL